MDHNHAPIPINQKSLSEAVSYLCKVDSDLANIILELGHPPLWSREPGFPTLVHIILEQQVSLASASRAFDKLVKATGRLTPERFLGFTDAGLKSFGFSRQKARYGRELSKAILSGQLDLDGLQRLDDSSARDELIKITGIGPWTADIYLLMALLRPDIWPTGDLALIKAIVDIKNLPETPTPERLLGITDVWKPWRSVAARIAWHYYLS
jgi:DNA-3-methyladenine glycosylase II